MSDILEELELRPFYHEAQVPVGKTVLHLVLDFRAIDIVEHLTKTSMDEVLKQLADIPQSLAAKLLWAMLRERHDAVTLAEAMALSVHSKSGVPLGVAMHDLLRRAYNLGDEKKAKGQNPRGRRGRSKTSSESGSQQG